MNANKDIKGWIALGVLVLGTFCTILALSTDHWYDFKVAMDESGIILFVFVIPQNVRKRNTTNRA